MKRFGFRPRKNEIMRKDSGQTVAFAGLFLIIFLVVLMTALLQMQMLRASSGITEDALAASGLASALIDIRIYGTTHEIQITNPEQAYARYCHALKENLGLNELWECQNHDLIAGRVEVSAYIIYNVLDDVVDVWERRGEAVRTYTASVGTVTTPEGQMVERTGVYSEITYPVEGAFGFSFEAKKGKLVEVEGIP